MSRAAAEGSGVGGTARLFRLMVERFHTLRDVTDCLSPFDGAQDDTLVGLVVGGRVFEHFVAHGG